MKALAAISLVVSILALALATAALLLARDDGGDDGRVITVKSMSGYDIENPVSFERDDFFFVRNPDFEGEPIPQFRALYAVVPHIYFGLEQGCRVKWQPDASFEKDGKTYVGIFSDPCSGSKFTVDGVRLFGPAARDLDQFLAVNPPGSDDVKVDTRILICSNNAQPCRKTLAGR